MLVVNRNTNRRVKVIVYVDTGIGENNLQMTSIQKNDRKIIF